MQILRMGPPCAILGLSWGHLGAILKPSCANLEAPWAILRPSWGYFALSWATLPLLSVPPVSVRIFKTCVSWTRNACFWNPLTLAVSRAMFGASLGLSWAILGYLAATLEPSWAILGPSRTYLGPSWGHPGRVYAKFAGANFA